MTLVKITLNIEACEITVFPMSLNISTLSIMLLSMKMFSITVNQIWAML
jgi:hypothetical protein